MRLGEIAEAIAVAEAPDAATALDLAFFAELVEASQNMVFRLLMNSIREVYFAHADLFRAIVAGEGSPGVSTPRRRVRWSAARARTPPPRFHELVEGQAERLNDSLAAVATRG